MGVWEGVRGMCERMLARMWDAVWQSEIHDEWVRWCIRGWMCERMDMWEDCSGRAALYEIYLPRECIHDNVSRCDSPYINLIFIKASMYNCSAWSNLPNRSEDWAQFKIADTWTEKVSRVRQSCVVWEKCEGRFTVSAWRSPKHNFRFSTTICHNISALSYRSKVKSRPAKLAIQFNVSGCLSPRLCFILPRQSKYMTSLWSNAPISRYNDAKLFINVNVLPCTSPNVPLIPTKQERKMGSASSKRRWR